MNSTLSIYDKRFWERSGAKRPEIPTLTLEETLAVLAMHAGTFVAVEVWPGHSWAGVPSLSTDGRLSPVRHVHIPELDDHDPLPPEIETHYFDLSAPGLVSRGRTLIPPRRIGSFAIDAVGFESARVYGHSATDAGQLSIVQHWDDGDDPPGRLSVVVRFYGSWER
jgi:hypothetical protein